MVSPGDGSRASKRYVFLNMFKLFKLKDQGKCTRMCMFNVYRDLKIVPSHACQTKNSFSIQKPLKITLLFQ
jgi:hypothetical protein